MSKNIKASNYNGSIIIKKNQPITAPKKNGGGSVFINSSAINKHCAFRQFSAFNPPLLVAANRYGQVKQT